MGRPIVLAEEILYQLGRGRVPMSLRWLCEQMGVVFTKGGWSRAAIREYNAVGAELQRLKRAGKVEYVGGKGAGWRVAGKRSRNLGVSAGPMGGPGAGPVRRG